MRFKAKLASEQVSLLYSLVVPISRLASSSEQGSSSLMRNGSMLRLDSEHLRLSVKGKSSDTDGIACFAELKAPGGIFLDHRIESAAENNAIVMELDIVQLRTALQSIQQERHNHHDAASTLMEQQYTVFKLAKRSNIPCLCLDAYTTSSSGGGTIQVHHAIPVRICRPDEMQHHLPPVIPLPDVQLEMPTDKPLRILVERLKHISPTIYLTATMNGELTIHMNNEGASIRAFFNQLIPRKENCKEGTTDCSVKVDTKKLTASLSWQQQTALVSSCLLCLVENEMLVLHMPLHPASVGFFTYYVPVHFLSHDPQDDE